MAKFKVEGLEEFQEKLKTIEKKAPDRILNKLDKEGNRLRKAMRANTPVGATGKLQKSYRLEPTKKVARGYEKGLYNRAPHHHLVNNGHRKVTPGGREIGWTEGRFYVEKTVAQEEGPIMGDLQTWLDDLFKELK